MNLQEKMNLILMEKMPQESSLFRMKWVQKKTPKGRPYPQLVASARPISDSGYGSWPTTTVHDAERGGQEKRAMGETRHGSNLQDFAMLASWPTAAARDWKNGQSNLHGQNARPLNEVAMLASWPTTTVHDAERGGQEKRAMGETWHGSNLQDFALLASWPTPCSQDGPNGGPSQGTDRLPEAASLTGPTPSGSPVATGNRGQLNPRLSGWLQGYPIAWDLCALRIIPTVRTRNVSSMPRSSKKPKRVSSDSKATETA